MRCPSCGRENPDAVKFCGECGASLEGAALCLECGFSNPPGTKFCHDCGQPLAEPSKARTPTPAPTPALPPSFASGRYQVQRFLGEGGKKRVYLARDSRLETDVAIALIKTEGLDAEGITRVRREAQAMGRLRDDPHIVGVLDIGDENGQLYLIQEYMAGGSLEYLLGKQENHRLDIDQAMRVAGEICGALAHAHDRGIVHRDLKPANIWLTKDGAAKLGDFGLAVALDRSRLTREGMMVGTASYMPPEQALGGDVAPRSDLYALGCVLYEMVAGRPPFLGDDVVPVISQHLNTAPVAPTWHRPDLPRALEAIILHLLEKDPAQRPASAYEVGRALAAIELSQEPSLMTATAEAPQPAGQDPIYRQTFVGREEELKQLRAAFDNALSGQGSLVMVVGEPGIGKTSVCEQLATYAALRGGRTLRGNCYEEGSLSLPYLPFVEALRAYVLSREPEELKSELGTDPAPVARIVSEVRDRVEVDLGPLGEAEEERYRLLQAVTSFLRNAAAVQPLLLILEDLHDADRGTLDLLTHLARRLAGARLLVAATYRDVEVDRSHPLSGTLAELRRTGSAAAGERSAFLRIPLRGLSAGDVRRMLSNIANREVQWQTAELVHRQTEGHPLFVQEVVRYLVEEGLLARDEGGRLSRTTDTPLTMSIPEGLRDVIGKRLSRLSQECNRLLSVAAVIGREFRLDVLQDVAGVSEEALYAALEEASATGIVEERRHAGAGLAYRFAHAFFRQTLYEETFTPRRIRFHQQVARAMEQRYAGRLEEHAAELAEHFAQSTEPADLAKAVEYATLAAERALSVFAYSEAAELLEQALNAQDVLDPADRRKRCELLVALGDAQSKSGDLDGAKETHLEAAELARQEADPALFAQVAIGYDKVPQLIGHFDKNRTMLYDEALTRLQKDDSAERTWLLAGLAWQLARTGSAWDQATALSREAVEIARRLGDVELLARALLRRGMLAQRPQELEERAATVAELGRLRALVTDSETLRAIPSLMIVSALESGDLTTTEEEMVEIERVAQLIRQPMWQREAALMRASKAQREGRFDEADALVAVANESYPLRDEHWEEFASVQEYFLRAVREALGASEAGPYLRVLEGRAERYGLPENHSILMRTYQVLSMKEEARREFEWSAADDFQRLYNVHQQLSFLAVACAYLGDRERAARLYELLLPYEGRNAVFRAASPLLLGSTSHYLGLLAATMGRWDDAARHFEDAIDVHTRLGLRPRLARTQHEYALMLFARDQPRDRPRALELANAALTAAQEMGMTNFVNEALALKVELQGVASTDIKTSIDAVAAAVERERPDLPPKVVAPDGTVTLLFTDIEDSTALNERLGDKRWMDILRVHHATVRDQIAAQGGFEVKSQGDGFMIAFGSARRALQCAIALQRAAADHNRVVDEPVQLRIGLHTGEAIKEADDFYGHHVNLAARIADQARGGEILVSSLLKDLTDSAGEFAFDGGRDASLKGISDTVRMFGVRWESS